MVALGGPSAGSALLKVICQGQGSMVGRRRE
jgi:hypothetical protein